MAVMAMFPLNTLLMPAMPLSLRIFEERYLKLLGDLIGEEQPEFGVVLIGRGLEVGGGENRLSIGTIASVENIGTLEQYYGIESVGTQRFRVNSWLPDDPYPMADVDLIENLIWNDSLMPSRVHLEAKVRNLLAFASEFGDLQYGPDFQLSENHMDACWQLAGMLPVGGLDQVDLLGSQSAEELISRTYDIVTTLDEALKAMAGDLSQNSSVDDVGLDDQEIDDDGFDRDESD